MLILHAPADWNDIGRVAFTPDGSVLIGGCNGSGVFSVEVGSGVLVGRHRFRFGSIAGPAFSPDGAAVYVPNMVDGLAELTCPGLERRHIFPREASSGWFVAVSPDGQRLSCSRSAAGGQLDRYGVAGLVRGDGALQVEWEQFDPGWIPIGVAFLADGQHLVTTEDRAGQVGGSRLAIRDAATGIVQREVACKPNELRELIASADGRYLAVMVRRSLLVWETADWPPRPIKVTNDARSEFTGVAFHPSGQYLAATSNDTTVKLYDTATWQVAKTFTWNVGRLRSVAFSPDGMLAAVGSDTGKIVVWDVDL